MKPSDAGLLQVLIENYEWALKNPALFPPQSDSLKQSECIAQLAKAELQRRAAPASVPAGLPWDVVDDWYNEWLSSGNPNTTQRMLEFVADRAAAYGREQAQQIPLTEDQIVACIVDSGCLGTVKLSYESGPYYITRLSLNADKLVRAIERAHGIQPPTGAAQ